MKNIILRIYCTSKYSTTLVSHKRYEYNTIYVHVYKLIYTYLVLAGVRRESADCAKATPEMLLKRP